MMDYLRDHCVFDTASPEKAKADLFSLYGARSFDLLADQKTFYAKKGFFDFGTCGLSYCSYAGPTKLHFGESDYVRFQFAISNRGLTTNGATSAEVTPQFVVSTPAEATLTFGESFRQLSVRISQCALKQDLSNLLGYHVKESVSFEMSTDATKGHAARFREKILYRAANIDITSDPIPAPLVKEIDQTIRLKALFAIQNNFSARINAPQQGAAPWQVARVEQWIDAHWKEDVSLDKLVEISGASARSIFATFKSARGYGPMTYLKSVRLEAARNMLMGKETDLTVTGIALSCGFLNMGHFASAYKARFGELPSETRRRLLGPKA